MATNAPRYRLLIDDTVYGPMTGEQVTDLISAGRLKEADRVSKDDGPWNAVTDFFPLAGTSLTESLSSSMSQGPSSQSAETPPPDEDPPLPPDQTSPPPDDSPPPSPDEASPLPPDELPTETAEVSHRPMDDEPEQPDFGKVARDFWTAAKAKAKDISGRATDVAKDLSGKTTGVNANLLNDLKDKALDVWRRAPTVVIVSSIGLVALCSSCFICAGFLSLIVGDSPHVTLESGKRNGAVSSTTSKARIDLTDVPEIAIPVIKQAIAEGKEVWMLTPKNDYDDVFSRTDGIVEERSFQILDQDKIVVINLTRYEETGRRAKAATKLGWYCGDDRNPKPRRAIAGGNYQASFRKEGDTVIIEEKDSSYSPDDGNGYIGASERSSNSTTRISGSTYTRTIRSRARTFSFGKWRTAESSGTERGKARRLN